MHIPLGSGDIDLERPMSTVVPSPGDTFLSSCHLMIKGSPPLSVHPLALLSLHCILLTASAM